MHGTFTAKEIDVSYIHELSDWPCFTWDSSSLTEPLAGVRYRLGRHLGRMEGIGFNLRREASVGMLTAEVVKSSAIEGEDLSTEEVRSSIGRRFGLEVGGLPVPSREVDGVVEMVLDATQNCGNPLSALRMHDWHAALFPTGRSGMYKIATGRWRDDGKGPMQVVSGHAGRERVHFQAPQAERLPLEMDRFIQWFNTGDDKDLILKAGIAHLYLVTIHPFDDGNGRIARAIADMALARADGVPERFYSMSSQIETERKEYYIQLESVQQGSMDITSWLSWFLGCLDRSIAAADTMLASVIRKAQLWQEINQNPTNDRQRSVINRMLEDTWEGHINSSKYAKLAKCSTDTALRDIRILVKRGIMLQNPGGGRSTSYRLR
jgi:Fic family protein